MFVKLRNRNHNFIQICMHARHKGGGRRRAWADKARALRVSFLEMASATLLSSMPMLALSVCEAFTCASSCCFIVWAVVYGECTHGKLSATERMQKYFNQALRKQV